MTLAATRGDGVRLQLTHESDRFTAAPRRVLIYRRGERRAVVWRSDQTLLGRRGRPYTVMLLRSDRGTCRQECHHTVPAALDTARGWVTKSIAE